MCKGKRTTHQTNRNNDHADVKLQELNAGAHQMTKNSQTGIPARESVPFPWD
jgi:hypothetical protein